MMTMTTTTTTNHILEVTVARIARFLWSISAGQYSTTESFFTGLLCSCKSAAVVGICVMAMSHVSYATFDSTVGEHQTVNTEDRLQGSRSVPVHCVTFWD